MSEKSSLDRLMWMNPWYIERLHIRVRELLADPAFQEKQRLGLAQIEVGETVTLKELHEHFGEERS